MPAWLPHIDSSVVLDGFISLLLLLSLLILRMLIVRAIAKNPTLSMDAKRRWVVSVRNTNTMVFVLLVGLVVIWAHEPQAFGLSLVALAAAFVLATKELILCWSGAALRIGGKDYSWAIAFRSQVIEVSSWIMTSLRPSSSRSGRAKRRISIRAA